MSKENGYIALYRDILFHWTAQDPVIFTAWVKLLLTVNHRAVKIPYNDGLLTIEPGQTLTSIRKLAKFWGVTDKKARGILNLFKSENMINCTTPFMPNLKALENEKSKKGHSRGSPKGTVITIVKWRDYQRFSVSDNEQGHTYPQKKGTERAQYCPTNNKENNEIKSSAARLKKKNEQPHDREWTDEYEQAVLQKQLEWRGGTDEV